MKEKINKLMDSHPEVFADVFLKVYPTDEELSSAEEILGIQIPDEYAWYLKTYGHGGFMFEFLGYGIKKQALFVEKTLYERNFGLPANLIVFENCDEYVICIDSVTKHVVSWSKHDSDGVLHVADDFYTYFIGRIQNAIENY